MPRRDQTPPYEIMRSRSAGSSGSAPAPAGDAGDPDATSGATAEAPPVRPAKAPWWVGSSAPLVLRIPRGLAILAVGGLLFVVVLAYLVGSVRGAAAAEPDDDDATMGERAGPFGYYIAGEDEYDGPRVETPELIVEGEDRRVEGMCYIRLVQTTEDFSRRIAEFMASRGVAIQLIRADNGDFRVYVLDRAYPPDQRNGESAQYYLSQMKQHGLAWKIHNGGQGDDLASMDYFQCVR